MAKRSAQLGNRFARLWVAATASLLGDGVTMVAFPLLMTQLTTNIVLIAGIQVAHGLPWLLSGPFGGVAADRFDRRKLMIVVNVMRAATVGALALGTSQGWISVALVYAVAFALGIGETFFDPAAQAMLPSIVPVDQLERANGRLYATESAAKELVGPAIGGLVFAGAHWLPFLVDAVSFALAALVIFGLAGTFRAPREHEAAPPTVMADLRAGWNFLKGNVVLRTLALMGAAGNFAAAAAEATIVVFALRVLHLQEWGFGILLACAAIGGTVAAVVADRVSGRFGPGTVIVGSWAGAGVLMLIVASTSNAALSALLFAGVFACTAFGSVVSFSLRQELTPSELLGRVSALYRSLLWSVHPLGALFGGVLAQTVSPRAPIVLFGVVALAVAACGALWTDNAVITRARAVPAAA